MKISRGALGQVFLGFSCDDGMQQKLASALRECAADFPALVHIADRIENKDGGVGRSNAARHELYFADLADAAGRRRYRGQFEKLRPRLIQAGLTERDAA